MAGSSPRVWGTLPRLHDAHDNIRFIPTRVGNAYVLEYRLSRASVHPHACGERLQVSAYTYQDFGSSPRVWGTPKDEVAVEPSHRFIPTRVGNA